MTNQRAALDWALFSAPHSSTGQCDCGYRLLSAMGTHWSRTGPVTEDRA